MRISAVFMLGLAACGMSTSEPSEPLRLDTISPAVGSVGGGTRVDLAGAGMSADVSVTIGGVACTSVMSDSQSHASCVTGDAAFLEGPADVVVTRGGESQTLPGAYTYKCLWQTSTGRTSCGAVPPIAAAAQQVDSFITQFQGDHGFTAAVAGAAASSMADTSDFTLGTQSVFVDTNGIGGTSTIARTSMPAIDFTGHMLKVWVRVDNIAHAAALDILVGDSNFSNAYDFNVKSTQGQQYMTDGDWVSFSLSWDGNDTSTRGAPNKAAITDIMLRVTDDATGIPVRLHANGLALVSIPPQKYPNGVVSFTFDDDWDTMISQGKVLLDAHGFPGTAFVIVDRIGTGGRATLADLHSLDADGWDIAAHAYTDADHSAMFTTLSPTAVEDDMVNSREWLIDQHFIGYDHCAYPSGEFDEIGQTDVLPIAAKYFTTCRTIFSRQYEAYPPSDPRKLRVFYASMSATLAGAEAAIDDARLYGDWVIIVNHKLVDVPAVSTDWPIANFTALVAYVAQSGVAVDTVTGVMGNGPRASASRPTP